MNRAKYIAIVGIDGCGKTTQAKLLVEYLSKKGIKTSYVWGRWQPWVLRPFIKKWKKSVTKNTGKPQEQVNEIKSAKLRIFSNKFFRVAWFLFFIVEYVLQVFFKVTLKRLAGIMVVSDRTFYDSMIDQSINLRRKNLIKSLSSPLMKFIFQSPNLAIYINCPSQTAFDRKNDIADASVLEERRILYDRLALEYKWTIVDGTLPVEEVFNRIKNAVDDNLK
jgi:dTMP kinase